MSQVIEQTAKTVEEAVQMALDALSLPRERVDVEILAMPSKGFLGFIGTKPARVRVTVKPLTPLELALQFLHEIFDRMRIEVSVEQKSEGNFCYLHLRGADLGILIGKHGQTLDALQYLSNLVANREGTGEKLKIVIDVESYRKRREETLRKLATRLADRVRRSGDKVVLEPMNRHERKIIHTVLQEDKRVFTYSDGEEPHRRIVIALKR